MEYAVKPLFSITNLQMEKMRLGKIKIHWGGVKEKVYNCVNETKHIELKYFLMPPACQVLGWPKSSKTHMNFLANPV